MTASPASMLNIPTIMVAGPSACGKTTLAAMLGEWLSRPVLSLDDYFTPTPRFWADTPAGRIRNYEHPSAYDGAALARDILDAGEPVVVEGFCLYQYPEVMRLPAVKLFLPTRFEICLERRRARRPSRISDKSFEIIGQQESERWVYPQAQMPGVVSIDPTGSKAKVLHCAQEAVLQRLR